MSENTPKNTKPKTKDGARVFHTLENFKLAADNVCIGICIIEVSAKPTAIYCNTEFLRIRGMSEIDQEMFLSDALHFASPNDSAEIYRLAKVSIETGEQMEYVYRVRNPDGKMPWIKLKFSHLKDLKGYTGYPLIIVTASDVSDYKALDTELTIQNERYKILEKTSSELLLEYIPETDKFFYSFTRPDTGFVRGELDNYVAERKYTRVVHPHSVQTCENMIITASRVPMEGEFEYLTKLINTSDDDDYQWHRLRYRSVVDESGKVICLLARAKNINQIVAERTMMKQIGSMDMLTGLLNRHSFVEQAEKLLHNDVDSIAFMLFDIDNFRIFNSTYGQAIGDRLIQTAAITLQRVFGINDIICRFEGDTFAVLMVNVDEKLALDKTEQFMRQFKKESQQQKFGVSVSCGAIWTRNSSYTTDELFGITEGEMDKVKSNGKGKASFFKNDK